jgi:hypothetical protein
MVRRRLTNAARLNKLRLPDVLNSQEEIQWQKLIVSSGEVWSSAGRG